MRHFFFLQGNSKHSCLPLLTDDFMKTDRAFFGTAVATC